MIADRVRRLRRGDDSGFALVWALLVTTLVTLGVVGTLVITAPNVIASSNSQKASGAMLAAESGINDAVAYLSSVPACRSETRICPQALGADSARLSRPSLGTDQSFHWTTNAAATADGYVRVRSVGTQGGLNRTLVADLSLNPSILRYGYYTNYESQTPTFLNSYWGPRKIYVSNANTYAAINTSYTSRTSAPQTISWNGAGNNPPSGYSDSVCAQHWYSDGTGSPGRGNATHQSTWEESGSLNGHSLVNAGSCDLVFTAGMVENGPTYSRDALDIANGSGNGPVFNQPVQTLWGYPGKNSPAAPTQPWRQSDGIGNDTLSASPYKPQIATQDITLPTTIGTDGVQTNSCVYYGPTRVVLNGNGTATVTSPETTSAASGADAGCYPSTVSRGVVNYTYNYNSVGAGTIYVKNLNVPSTSTWPVTTLKSTSTPSAANTVFWIPDTSSTVTADPSSSASSSTCASGNTYSASANATCSWTNLPNGTSASSSQGWTSYTSSGTASYCSTVIGSGTATDRELFECEYNHVTGASTPTTDAYAAVRSAVQGGLAGGTCVGGALSDQQSCIVNAMNTGVLNTADTGGTYNASNPANGAHQYYAAWKSNGTAASATSSLNPTPGDSLFSFTGTPGQEKSTSTPMTFTVYRQTYSSGKWGAGVPQFTFTVVHTDWAVTSQPNGYDYFPSTQDVTPYAMGSTAAGAAAGTTGPDQPGDLYVQGTNQGTLSLIAQNNVELTGDILESSGNTSTANPVSITAGNDVRNYHPVSCVDQTAADINATTAGYCPNDVSGIYSGTLLNSDGSFTAQHPAAQYSNILGTGDRTIDAALFTLTGSLRTDNYSRGNYVGNLNVFGGIYQDYRGANGITYGNSGNTPGHAGTSLNYTYVDLERANLQYVPTASYSSNPRVWNVVSISAGS